MPFQLNPSKVAIWKSETELQLGIQPDAQTLADVTHGQERLIEMLFQGIAEDQLDLMGKNAGLSQQETDDLVEQLRPSLLERTQSLGQATRLDVRFAEIIRIGFETAQTSEHILANRYSTTVLIPVVDRTGLALIKALGEAGFQDFVSVDYEGVRRSDLGELGYPVELLGVSRLTAARELLAKQNSKVSVSHIDGKHRVPAIAILSAMHHVNPKTYRETLTPHVAIEYGLTEIRISPVITPGYDPCLGCRDLWESENDSAWASTAIQLVSRGDQLDDGAALLFAVGTAAKTICNFVDRESQMLLPGFRVDLRTRSVSRYEWQFHPGCYCRSKR